VRPNRSKPYKNEPRRRANRQEEDRRLNSRLKRTIAGFLSDHPAPTTRELGRLLIEEVQASIDDSAEDGCIKLHTEKLRRDFDLNESLIAPIKG
jgi:hypothetical protein